MGRFTPFLRRTLAAATAALVVGSGLMFVQPALADTAPQPPTSEATVSTDPLPTVQINGVVWDQVIVGNTVYVGGSFSNARPAGAAPGVNTVTRTNLLAYNLTTGALITSFAHTLNGQVKAVAASPDGTRVYIGGEFTQVNGASRSRIAAFSTATGALISSFAPPVNHTVSAIAATNSTVYIGGSLSAVGSSQRPRIAALSASNGAVLPFAPNVAGGTVFALVVSPDASKVVLGGSFTTVNGSGRPGYGLAAVHATTGALLPWNVNNNVRNGGPDAAIFSLSSDGDSVYGTGYHYGGGGNLEGAFRSDWNGNLVWIQDCHGDSYSVAATAGAVYVASHAYYCGNSGGFPATNPRTFQRGMAWSKAVSGNVNRPDIYGYPDHRGTPVPKLLNFWPDINQANYTGMWQGPWDVTANSKYVAFAGEFTRVNNVPQQGIVRFATADIAPNRDGPRLSGANFIPTVTSPASGTARLSWVSNYDRDNQYLTYEVIRNGATGSPVHRAVGASRIWWDRPVMVFTDTGLTPGQTYTYRLRATDPFGNQVYGNTVSVTVSGSSAPSAPTDAYGAAVFNDFPSLYWRLGESSGSTAADTMGAGNTGVYSGGVTKGVAGAVAGTSNTAASFNGSTGLVHSSRQYTNPQVYSLEAWFRTTSIVGGKVLGFGSSQTGNSGSYDRHIYLQNDGKVVFGTYTGRMNTITSPNRYNDGSWHHVVATQSSSGLRLYLDGALIGTHPATSAEVYNGYWRIGGDNTWGSTSRYLNGRIDEVAVYGSTLDATDVQRHYAAGRGTTTSTPTTNTAPTASFTTSTSGLTVSTNGSASSDPNGTITGYAWNFGDGATASGSTASHSYAAAGTYTVTLTVSDNGGATGSTSRQVTVSAPPPAPAPDGVLATDGFARTVSNGWGSADAGGAWTIRGTASNYSVGGGFGKMFSPSASTLNEAVLTAVSSANTDVTVKASFEQALSGNGTYVSLIGRRIGTNDYRAQVVVQPNGSVHLVLQRNSTALVSRAVAGLTYSAGDQLQVRLQVTGTAPTTIQAKVWRVGTAEPAAWVSTITDSTAALQGAGSPGLATYLSGGATIPMTVRFDDLRVATP